MYLNQKKDFMFLISFKLFVFYGAPQTCRLKEKPPYLRGIYSILAVLLLHKVSYTWTYTNMLSVQRITYDSILAWFFWDQKQLMRRIHWGSETKQFAPFLLGSIYFHGRTTLLVFFETFPWNMGRKSGGQNSSMYCRQIMYAA